MKHAIYICLFFCLPVAGCALSPAVQVERADRDAYSVIAEKTAGVSGEAAPFTIEYETGSVEALDEYRPAGGRDTPVLSLEDTLEIAARHSREYQERREQLYLRSLDLVARRHAYGPRVDSAGLEADLERSGGETRLGAGLSFSLVQWLADGARLTLGFSGNFLRLLSGDAGDSLRVSSRSNLLQPLMRGAGQRVALEELTMAERETVYQARSFLRYQRSFSVDIAGRWFRLVRQGKILENEENNYERLLDNRRRMEMLGEAGRVPMLQVDQARQDVLEAEERLVVARTAYRQEIDNFKLRLGLPPEVDFRLREEDLDVLMGAGLPEPGLDLETARQAALRNRLDLLNSRDAVEDAERGVELAADDLRSRLDLRVSFGAGTAVSGEGATGVDRAAGLELDLPVDDVGLGNAYRRKLVELDRRRRAYELYLDSVDLEVRDAWRTLEQARQSYEIEERSLELARRRVESVRLLMDAGRATQRDVQEAQSSLLRAQNALVRTLVSYYLAYLDFLRDTELLPIGEDGVWIGGFDA